MLPRKKGHARQIEGLPSCTPQPLPWQVVGYLERCDLPQSLREFMLDNHQNKPEQQFLSLAITIDKHSPILGTSLKAADLRNKWSCLVVGLERGAFTITNPHVSLVFEENDLLWVLGKQKMMNTLIREEIL